MYMELNVRSADELRAIRKQMRYGDIATIARETGYSSQTVQMALRGKISTLGSEVIIRHALRLIQDRKDRIEHLKTVIKPMYAK